MAENPNEAANVPAEVAERIRAAVGEAIEDAAERLVTRWAVVVESVPKDGEPWPALERLCEPTMAGWDMRGMFAEGAREDGWKSHGGDDDG